jgi:hypothetical protein
MPGKAHVEKVGGTRERGPWPTDVEEVVAGEAYNRLVDGVEKTVEVVDVESEEGEGHAVAFHHDGGGSP